MVFAHDTTVALQAAVALANSALEPDTMTTLAELDAWYVAYSYSGRRDRNRAELDAVRAIRPRLLTLLTIGPDEAAAEVNAIRAQMYHLAHMLEAPQDYEPSFNELATWHSARGSGMRHSRNRRQVVMQRSVSRSETARTYRRLQREA